MNWISQNCVYGRTFGVASLNTYDTMVGGAGLIGTGKLRLSHQAGFNPTPDTALADLEAQEAAFTGYPAGGIAVVLTDPVNFAPNLLGVQCRGVFICGTADPQVTDTVYGWWIDDGTDMKAAEPFPLGVTWAAQNPGDFLDLIANLPWHLIQSATS